MLEKAVGGRTPNLALQLHCRNAALQGAPTDARPRSSVGLTAGGRQDQGMRASLTKMFGNVAFAAAAAVLLLSGCSDRPAPTEGRLDQAKDTGASFVNKVWSVSESSGVAPGTLYVFLAEGTLVIASASGKPAFGTWRYENGALTMVEEGIAYKVDVLQLSQDEFRIRSHNPGKPVEITMVTADASPRSR